MAPRASPPKWQTLVVQKPLTDLGVHILRAPLPQQPQELHWEKLPDYFL